MSRPLRVHRVWPGRCPLLGPSLYVWVQGCPRRCPGCFNEEALDNDGPADEMTPEALAHLWAKRAGGLVLSGGEPFSQATGLAELCRAVRRLRPNTPILVYTGFRLEELLREEPAGRLDLLRQVDVLVDGPFLQSRPSDMPLVGSDNQRVFRFGDRVSAQQLDGLRRPQIQAELDASGRLRLVGTGNRRADMNRLVEILRNHGLHLEG